MPQLTRNHPSETLHCSASDEVPTRQATIEWMLGSRYLALGNHARGIRHLLKSAVWLERAGAPQQAQQLRRQVAAIGALSTPFATPE